MAKTTLRATVMIALLGTAATAQAQPAQIPPAVIRQANATREIPTPPQPGAIPLLAGVAGTGPGEQWEQPVVGGRTVRNVTDPTVTPFLPEPGKATGAAVIVAPGGGFYSLSIDDEGYQVARWLADHGVAAFVLKYRPDPTPRDVPAFTAAVIKRVTAIAKGDHFETPPQALEDASAAVRLVRNRAAEWGVDPRRVGFVGFSAGAITALSVGVTDDKTARPDFIAPIYGPMYARAVPADAPPLFVAIALDDPIFARGGESFGLVDSWRTARRPVEAHLYERGGHGFGLGKSAATKLWADEFYAWMQDRGLLRPGR